MADRYLVAVYLTDHSIKPSRVLGNLGSALRASDAYSTRPSVVLSGPVNMLKHARRAFAVPPQRFLSTQGFLKHVYAVAELMGFTIDSITNIASWDINKAKEKL